MTTIPSSDMPLPTWRKNLETSLEIHQHQAQSRYMQLASCSVGGQPRVRTVVYRGFVEQSNFLTIHTDIRSEKCAQFTANPMCEINWYFTDSREQYRITGEVLLVKEETSELRLAHWQKLSFAAKADYAKTIPGIPLPTKTQMTLNSENINEQTLADPHKNFVLLVIKPNAVDHVMLLPNPHQRVMHECDEKGVWQSHPITP